MRFVEYIWAVISPNTPWTMGNNVVQIFSWAIGMLAPGLFMSGLVFRLNKTAFVISLIFSVIAVVCVILWLTSLDYWMHAPPPKECDREACDNDGEIRTLFLAGTFLIPVALPSLILGPISFFVALHRLVARNRPSQFSVR